MPIRSGGPSGTSPSRTGGGNRLWTPSSERMRELNLHGFVDYKGLSIPEKINASVDEQQVLKDLGIGKKRIKKIKKNGLSALSSNERKSYDLTVAMRRKRLREFVDSGIHLTEDQMKNYMDPALERIKYKLSA